MEETFNPSLKDSHPDKAGAANLLAILQITFIDHTTLHSLVLGGHTGYKSMRFAPLSPLGQGASRLDSLIHKIVRWFNMYMQILQ
jgi:hypothetical protein